MHTTKRFGIELEGGVYEQDGKTRVDLPTRLGLGESNNFNIRAGSAGLIGVDNGIHEIEFSISPSYSIEEAGAKLLACSDVVYRNDSTWKMWFTGQDPLVQTGYLPPSPWARKQRYDVIRRIIAKERSDIYPKTGSVMDWMSQYWSYQLHLEIDPASSEGNLLQNWLNNWGPHICRSATESLGNPSNRLERAWVGWGDMRRLPAFHWFENAKSLKHAWRSVPRLARKIQSEWVPDQRTALPRIGEDAHEGFVWWGVRPRWRLGTIEFRWCDALPQTSALILTRWILAFANAIITGYTPYKFSQPEWTAIRNSRESWLGFVTRHSELRINFEK